MKAITLAVAVCLTSMSALAGVGIQDIRVVAKGQICIVFEADYTSDIASNQLPLLRSYPLIENQRVVSSSYGPFALGIPGQHTVTEIVKKKRGEGREALDGLHVGLYEVAGEKMIASPIGPSAGAGWAGSTIVMFS